MPSEPASALLSMRRKRDLRLSSRWPCAVNTQQALGTALLLCCTTNVAMQSTFGPSSCSQSSPTRAPTNDGHLPGTSPTTVTFLAGILAGVTVDVPLHPLDTLKTRFQAPEGFKTAGGFQNLWSGLSPVLLRSLPCSAIFFVTYDHLRCDLHRRLQLPGSFGSACCDAAAASVANVAACAVRVPCEVLKQRMQVQCVLSRTQPTLLSVGLQMSAEGIHGLYSGFGATMCRELAFAAIHMPVFEELKRMHPWSTASASGAQHGLVGMMCGGAAGCLAGLLTTPLDVAKTRLMLKIGGSNVGAELIGLFAAGPKELFRGGLCRTSYVGLSCALSFGAFEWSRKLLSALTAKG